MRIKNQIIICTCNYINTQMFIDMQAMDLGLGNYVIHPDDNDDEAISITVADQNSKVYIYIYIEIFLKALITLIMYYIYRIFIFVN